MTFRFKGAALRSTALVAMVTLGGATFAQADEVTYVSGAVGNGQSPAAGLRSVAGFQPFPSQGVLITNAQIDALRDAEGV